MDKEFTLIILAQKLFGENSLSFEYGETSLWCMIDSKDNDIGKFEILNDVAVSCNCKIHFNFK